MTPGGFWRRRSTPPREALAARLRRYPPCETAPAGLGTVPSPAQAATKLAEFERVRPQRLRQVSALLHDDAGLDTGPALAEPARHAAALADALQRWAGAAWPAPRPQDSVAHWLASRRCGEDIVYSMLLDLAILLGELIHRGNPAWRWGLDLDPENLADGIITAHRIVLTAEPVGTHTTPFVLDVEGVVVYRFLHPDAPAQRLLNPLRQLVERGLRGDDFAAFRGP